MLTHGVAPRGLLLSKLVPIPTNKRRNKFDSIIIERLLLVVYLVKYLSLTEQRKSLQTDKLQFRFKQHSPTVICTALLKDTIDNGRDCYLLLLDASKAFDRVECVNFFNILRDRELCPFVLRLIMNMYTNQEIQVK